MEGEERRLDLGCRSQADAEREQRDARLLFRLNHTPPDTAGFRALLCRLLPDLGEGSSLTPPMQIVWPQGLTVGKDVSVSANLLALCFGGVVLEDGVRIAANVSLLSHSHDFYDRRILLCRPIRVCRNAWIGAGAALLPGVRVGRWAVVGAHSVVTRDVPDYAVAAGSPARVLKILDSGRFGD